MRRRLIYIIPTFLFLVFISCGGIDTLPMHTPIYPTSEEQISISLETRADRGVARVELYGTLVNPTQTSDFLSETESLLYSKDFEDTPETAFYELDNIGPFPPGSTIRYRFLVKDKAGHERSHDVTFTIQSDVPIANPVSAEPIPIYCQGSRDHVMDAVFIPDEDIDQIEDFYKSCEIMIKTAMFEEPTLRKWSRQFDFYINPVTGDARDVYDEEKHVKPMNWVNISSAELKIIMHKDDFIDYTITDLSLCSAELENCGTLLHEAGHAMFDLRDEYHACGAHGQATPLPNNWDCQQDAKTSAYRRHKTSSDVKRIGKSGWFKICNDDCQMKWSGRSVHQYGKPCADRVVYSIKNASISIQDEENGE